MDGIPKLKQDDQAFVLATVIGVQGSTPRESGTKMLITADTIYDTIGGGHLEYKVMEEARCMLAEGGTEAEQKLKYFPLSASLGQCCGGSVSVMFEYFPANAPKIMLFGAGHIGKALVTILQELPYRTEWVDSRKAEFPQTVAGNIAIRTSEKPADEVDDMPPGSLFVIMTHNHQLDLELTEAILKRDDFSYLGVIGSRSKSVRFRKHLTHKGYDEALVNKMLCPIGLSQVPGKKPMEVAVSIAGELIGLIQQQDGEKKLSSGVNWREVRRLIQQS